eukprot:CAMPEP_0202865896 /NCGR_PEP_ID=MMETSP1391-20130828/6645_1 /ASSEMBLY_ACC=CAM_ASM_000867 /TAXON_ID=1034604 /ORGANISM="Chlamydomonas leiostraca, Strain SAG 11-49" /LENGTH=236 /DNA_ID=CAMNT_0049545785 /DNA_START=23 /DNA_END=733 /DNA_ORIENTATION=+
MSALINQSGTLLATRAATRAPRSRVSICAPSRGQHDDACSTSSSSDEVPHFSRRMLAVGLVGASLVVASPSKAVGFKKELKKKRLGAEDYIENEAVGLKIHENDVGKGSEEVAPGDRVVVHYDCLYRGIDVVSSRAARLLGGNRTVAEPYEYVVGEPVTGIPLKKISEGANGLFAGSSGPKPPQALSRAVLGMKKGGKRSVLVDQADLGYPKGVGEMPAGETFELVVEVLEIFKKA